MPRMIQYITCLDLAGKQKPTLTNQSKAINNATKFMLLSLASWPIFVVFLGLIISTTKTKYCYAIILASSTCKCPPIACSLYLDADAEHNNIGSE